MQIQRKVKTSNYRELFRYISDLKIYFFKIQSDVLRMVEKNLMWDGPVSSETRSDHTDVFLQRLRGANTAVLASADTTRSEERS